MQQSRAQHSRAERQQAQEQVRNKSGVGRAPLPGLMQSCVSSSRSSALLSCADEPGLLSSDAVSVLVLPRNRDLLRPASRLVGLRPRPCDCCCPGCSESVTLALAFVGVGCETASGMKGGDSGGVVSELVLARSRPPAGGSSLSSALYLEPACEFGCDECRLSARPIMPPQTLLLLLLRVDLLSK